MRKDNSLKANTLVVFDLDRTLLNRHSKLSQFTLQTLRDMDAKGIHYTIATGRSFLSAASTIADHTFKLPQVYTNGVVTWCPRNQKFSFDNCLTLEQGLAAINEMESDAAHPFFNAIDDEGNRFIYHGDFRNPTEQQLLKTLSTTKDTKLMPIEKVHQGLRITNISMIGPSDHVISAHNTIDTISHLIAYSGQAVERDDYRWIDIHHQEANKGTAITRLKEQLNIETLICFGDGDNDISMFSVADECYAPENANDENKQAATAVIGHHDEDGVAHLLRERFSL